VRSHAQVGALSRPPHPALPRPDLVLLPGGPLPMPLKRPLRPLAAVATMEPLEAQRDIPDMGRDLWNRSYYPTGPDAAALHKDWFIVDATGQTLGRLAVLVSTYIRSESRHGPLTHLFG